MMALMHLLNHERGYNIISSLAMNIIWPAEMRVWLPLVGVSLEFNHVSITDKRY